MGKPYRLLDADSTAAERRMIMRLIDADRAMEIVRDQGIAHPNAYHLTNYATLILREAPTVDAVEVVRKPVKGYEGYYEVDQFGRVFGLERIIKVNDNGRNYEKPIAGKQLKQSMHTKGYKTVSLTKDGKTKTLFVHRLVAEAFIPNVYNLPMVNHKDEDKTNNFVENLEWCTNDYNINYGTARRRQAKKIRGIPHTDEHKKKISESMKAYREKEKAENGYCYNGRGKRKGGAD